MRDVSFDALNHAELPFEVLMDHLDVRSVNGRNPLSQCYFFYQQAFLRPRELAGLTITPLPDFGLGTHFELQMGLLDRREGLRAQLEYNPDLFDATTVRQVLEDYKGVLELMRDVPEARLHELKVSRRAPLAHLSSSSSQPSRIEVEPRRGANPTERKLQKIWESLLGTSPIGLNQNYFDLGGTSILAVRLFAQISREFQRKLPLSILFEAQTIAQLAKVVADRSHLIELVAAGSDSAARFASTIFLHSWGRRECSHLSRPFASFGRGSAVLWLAGSRPRRRTSASNHD